MLYNPAKGIQFDQVDIGQFDEIVDMNNPQGPNELIDISSGDTSGTNTGGSTSSGKQGIFGDKGTGPEYEVGYTNGDEYYNPNGTPYIGYYHIMENGVVMTGRGHSTTSQILTRERAEIEIDESKFAISTDNITDYEFLDESVLEERYPGLIRSVFNTLNTSRNGYWRIDTFKSQEDYAGVEVLDSINTIGDVRAHLEWMITPPNAPNDVELRDVDIMGKYRIIDTRGEVPTSKDTTTKEKEEINSTKPNKTTKKPSPLRPPKVGGGGFPRGGSIAMRKSGFGGSSAPFTNTDIRML